MWARIRALAVGRMSNAPRFLKDADPGFKVLGDLPGCLLLREALRLHFDQRLPETRAPDGKPDEPGNARRCFEPMHDSLSVCYTSQHNETHGGASSMPSRLHQLDTIFSAVQPFDLPDIGLHASILQSLDGLPHQAW